MTEKEAPPRPLSDLKSGERSIVLSFLALSERETDEDRSAADELALSMALKASLKNSPN